MADNLDEALAAGNGDKAVRLYWDLVDQAYGKTAQQVEVKAGPLRPSRLSGRHRMASRPAPCAYRPEVGRRGYPRCSMLPLAVWPGGRGCCPSPPVPLPQGGERKRQRPVPVGGRLPERAQGAFLHWLPDRYEREIPDRPVALEHRSGRLARVGDTNKLDPEHLPVFQVRGPGDVAVQHPPVRAASRSSGSPITSAATSRAARQLHGSRDAVRLRAQARVSASSPPGQPSASVATSRATEAASPSAPSSTNVPSGRSVNASLRVTATAAQRTPGHTAGQASTPGPPPLVAGYHPPPAAAGACPSPGQATHTPQTHGRWPGACSEPITARSAPTASPVDSRHNSPNDRPPASTTDARFREPDGRPAPDLRPPLDIDQAAALISFDTRDSDHRLNGSRSGRCHSQGDDITPALVVAGVHGSLLLDAHTSQHGLSIATGYVNVGGLHHLALVVDEGRGTRLLLGALPSKAWARRRLCSRSSSGSNCLPESAISRGSRRAGRRSASRLLRRGSAAQRSRCVVTWSSSCTARLTCSARSRIRAPRSSLRRTSRAAGSSTARHHNDLALRIG